MRVINLDETGIKLLNDKKNQIYLNKDEIIDFVKGKYQINENVLKFNTKSLSLSDVEVKQFPNIITYLKNNILKEE